MRLAAPVTSAVFPLNELVFILSIYPQYELFEYSDRVTALTHIIMDDALYIEFPLNQGIITFETKVKQVRTGNIVIGEVAKKH